MAGFCSSCGKPIAQVSKFCPSCGMSVTRSPDLISQAHGDLDSPDRAPIASWILTGLCAGAALAGIIYAAYRFGQEETRQVGSNIVAAPAPANSGPRQERPSSTEPTVKLPVNPPPADSIISFSRYAGTFPADGFLDDPAVKRLVRASVPRRSLLAGIGAPGTHGRIRVAGKYLLAFGCEAGNCVGGDSWSVVIIDAKAGQFARVCIHDSRQMNGYSEWYENATLKNIVDGDCPFELSGS